MSGLLDVGALVAAIQFGSDRRAKIDRWLSGVDPGRAFVCDMALSGALRVATTSAAMGASRLTPGEAWKAFSILLSDPVFTRVVSSAQLDREWKTLLDACVPSAKADTDLYLLAFAKALEVPFVTFDEALARRFPDAEILVPV